MDTGIYDVSDIYYARGMLQRMDRLVRKLGHGQFVCRGISGACLRPCRKLECGLKICRDCRQDEDGWETESDLDESGSDLNTDTDTE